MKLRWCYLSAALLVLLDQVTKALARAYLPQAGTVPLIPGVLGLTYVENTGMAFSALSGNTPLLAAVSLAASAALVWVMQRRLFPHPFCQWMLSLVLAGAVGNLIDRLFLGYVTDMIQALFVQFPVFNVADCCVVAGVIGLMAYVLFFWKDKEASHDQDPPHR